MTDPQLASMFRQIVAIRAESSAAVTVTGSTTTLNWASADFCQTGTFQDGYYTYSGTVDGAEGVGNTRHTVFTGTFSVVAGVVTTITGLTSTSSSAGNGSGWTAVISAAASTYLTILVTGAGGSGTVAWTGSLTTTATANIYGETTVGSVATYYCRLENRIRSVERVDGTFALVRGQILFMDTGTTTPALADRFWLPGHSVSTAAFGQHPKSIDVCVDENGAVDHWELSF